MMVEVEVATYPIEDLVQNSDPPGRGERRTCEGCWNSLVAKRRCPNHCFRQVLGLCVFDIIG